MAKQTPDKSLEQTDKRSVAELKLSPTGATAVVLICLLGAGTGVLETHLGLPIKARHLVAVGELKGSVSHQSHL